MARGSGWTVRAASLADLEAEQRPAQRLLGTPEVGVGVAPLQTLHRAVERSAGPLRVDLLGALGDLRQNADAIGKDLRETARRGQVATLRPAAEHDPTDPEGGQKGCVPWQDAQVALAAG